MYGSLPKAAGLAGPIAAAFSVTVAQAGVLPGVFSIALAVVAPVVGLGGRQLPRLWLVVGGLACFAAAWAGALLVRDFLALLAFVGLAGAALALAVWLGASMRGVSARFAQAAGSPRSLPSAQAIPSAQGDPSAQGNVRVQSDPSAPAVPSLRESLRIDLTDRATLIVLAANLLDMGAFYAVFSFAGAELRRANGWGALPAGLMVAGYGLGLAIVTFNARLIDRWGMKRTGVGALLALALVLPTLPWLVGTPSLFAVGVVLWGCVQGAFFTSITTLATIRIPPLRGVVTALLSSATYLGVSAYTPLSIRLYAEFGYAAVGVLAGSGCVAAALLLARLPRSAPVPTAGSRPRSR